MATGRIITQTDNGRVTREGGYGYYIVHIYDTGEKHHFRQKNKALELFRKLDVTARTRYMMRVRNERLQEDTYGRW